MLEKKFVSIELFLNLFKLRPRPVDPVGGKLSSSVGTGLVGEMILFTKSIVSRRGARWAAMPLLLISGILLASCGGGGGGSSSGLNQSSQQGGEVPSGAGGVKPVDDSGVPVPSNGGGDTGGDTGGGSGGGGDTGGGGTGGDTGDTGGTPPPPTPPPPPPPSGDPSTGLTFTWFVNGIPFTPPAFTLAPGPTGSARNLESRLQLTHELALVLHRRVLPGSAVSLLEVAVWNDPLICQVQPAPGQTIPSQTIPNLDLQISGGKGYPIFPALSTWKIVTLGSTYHLQLTDPSWAKIADGAGYAWPFIVTTDTATAPKISDLYALFPPNPGSIWAPVAADYPAKEQWQIDELNTGGAYFTNSGDPWAVMGSDVKYTPQTGYQPDWFWCHLGSYYARNDYNDILYIMPTVYRQAARPCHFYGFDGSSSAFFFNMSRPAKWSTNPLGRVPVDGNELYIAPVADTHDWYGYDHQHASARRVAEYALATGSPFAWRLMLYYGELSKAMLRTLDPQPWGSGFPSTPRGYLGWLEIAYMANMVNPNFDMTVQAKSFEDFLELGHVQGFGKAWGTPQVMWAFINDKWIPGHYAAASFEDLRSVPVLLKVGRALGNSKLIQGALEKCEWYCTTGYTNGVEGKGVGIKRLVDPFDPNVFVDADLSGYNRVSALGLKLAAEYLQNHPTPGFNGPLYKTVSDAIKTEAKANPSWQWDYAGWMHW